MRGGIKLEDAHIVQLYLQRDESAIDATARRYGARLLNLANSILQDIHMAEECENDTYLAAWNNIPPHEPFTYLFAFLARITRHLALDRCRVRSQSKRNVLLVELTREMEQCLPAPGNVEDSVDARIMGAAISKFLREISEERRLVFLRRYWYMDSISDVAKRFSLSESAVKTMLFRIRQELKSYLRKEGLIP